MSLMIVCVIPVHVIVLMEIAFVKISILRVISSSNIQSLETLLFSGRLLRHLIWINTMHGVLILLQLE